MSAAVSAPSSATTLPVEEPPAPGGLSRFAEEVFAPLPRSDQRRWAEVYLCGLLTVPGKKTIRSMARGIAPCAAAAHALQQFISASPWDWLGVREALARAAAGRLPEHVWTVGTTVIEKRGEHSVGVRRRTVAETGRTVNCQVGVGLFLTSAQESVPVGWRLLLDGTWAGDPARRRRARIPEGTGAEPAWAHVAELTDRLAELRVSGQVPLVADLSAGVEPAELAARLGARRRDFVLEIAPDRPVLPGGPGMPGGTAVPDGQPVGVERLTAYLAARHPQLLSTERRGGGRPVDVLCTPVRLPGPEYAPGRAAPVHRLVAELSPRSRRPARYWITSLRRHRTAEVLALARRSALTGAAVQRLQNDYGLRDFEGRSFPGWHHHMTLASAAYVYRRLYEGAGAAYCAAA
ncbi:hypothetical protein ADL22_05185 [Streptomyces sp. NRRL F-4489]|uniref:IS701 family transposase n=1 Tax=Streptomyces sp. NRRL F-4489 TaxID=1609095 RepID=UPI0007464473|nr:transposase [Streptomyces sp. NRRL F-4489]KUL52333.1 hypothetical protein ADL22_05185 [Streptomyces sp. NRRL F-4489]